MIHSTDTEIPPATARGSPSPLNCVGGVPTPTEDDNLRTIPDTIKRLGLVTGLSDHTLDNTIASVVLDASIIEKHFTLDRSGGGPDDSFSLEPAELAALCRGARTAWNALGQVDYGRKSSELGNAQFRRSLYFVRAAEAGEVVTSDMIRSVRPGYGLPPKYLNSVIGCFLLRSVHYGTPVTPDTLKTRLDSDDLNAVL